MNRNGVRRDERRRDERLRSGAAVAIDGRASIVPAFAIERRAVSGGGGVPIEAPRRDDTRDGAASDLKRVAQPREARAVVVAEEHEAPPSRQASEIDAAVSIEVGSDQR